jgi:threonine/homoserine/homoserine lactone efflux protein
LNLDFFLKGLAIGFSIAAPVGPIGLLCIQRTLAKGRSSGLISGLGAATADAMYGGVAGFGLAYVSTFLINQQTWLRLIGGTFLICLGLRIWFRKPVDATATTIKKQGLVSDYASTLALTLTNPVTIISFAAIFAGLGLGSQGQGGDYTSAAMLVSGVFAGSAAWWVFLSSAVGMFRRMFSPGRMRLLNRISGSVIVIFGLVAILSLVL